MKKLYLIPFMIVYALAAFAQNVGIGTNEPAARLHVADSNVLFSANVVNGAASGQLPNAGSLKFLWYGEKGALRSGRFINANWSKENVGVSSVAFGDYTIASGLSSISLGAYSQAEKNYAFAGGFSSRAMGASSFAFGEYAYARTEHAVALGISADASGTRAIAVGGYSNASGNGASAIGNGSFAAGLYAVALNRGTANGEKSFAVFGKADAIDAAALSGGFAGGDNSFSFGLNSRAEGNNAIAIGSQSLARGVAAVSLGFSEASGDFSFTANRNTWAQSGYETVIGRFNTVYTPISTTGWAGSDRLFVVGNGASVNSRSNALTVFKNGNIGIMTGQTNARLTVNGDASKIGGGLWLAWSDARLKKNIVPYQSGLKEILQINPVRFQYNELSGVEDLDKNYVGIIAQEIEKILPSTISIKKDDKMGDKRMFDGSELTYALINAVKEQQIQIEILKKELIELKNRK